MTKMWVTCTAFVLLIQPFQSLAFNDSPFQLTNRATGFCLVKRNTYCYDIRWTTGGRLLVPVLKKCLGVQGKSVGSEINLYDCDENSELQKWECKNETAISLQGQELYIKLTADNTATLSKTVGPNNQLTISGSSSGACTRTHRELYTIDGNANGRLCMFPFQYKDQWYTECTRLDSTQKRLWCAVETKFDHELWGFCPTNSREHWNKHPTTGAYYQLNTQAAVTWPQAEASCKQQSASLLSISDPHEQAYVIALLGKGGNKLWTGLVLSPEHGWHWANGRPYRYLKWDSGYPLHSPGHNCAIFEPAVQYSWQSSPCSKNLGYICYSPGITETPTQASETGFCSSPWIPYNGHCFQLQKSLKTWPDAQRECVIGGGNLVSIRNIEDQSFVISQLGYAATDELWIGLNDRKTEGLFDWSDHATVSFTSWEFGEPDVSTELQDCVLIRGENGNWADRTCQEKHGFICMKSSALTPSGDEVELNEGCKTGWKRHGSYCYYIATETKTFDAAKEHCKSSGSYLADVSNGVDNAFIVSLVGMRPEKYFWLGLSNQKNFDAFVWTNTDSVKFTHWNALMPGNLQGCVAITTGIFAGLWDVLPCTDRQKYICKHLAEGASLTPAPPTAVPTGCPDRWSPVGKRRYCYRVYSELSTSTSSSGRKTWFEARDYCRALGGDLLSIHSSEDQESLPDRYSIYWIGLSAPDPAAGYVWTDGSALQFQHWEEGEPNNRNNVESCAEFKMHRRSGDGSWNDVHCEKYNGWICQIRAGVKPKPPPERAAPDYNRTSDGWIEWGGNQYFFKRSQMAAEEARYFCKQRHSDLVTINSEAESVFLWKQISTSSGFYWIGMNVDLDGTYGWMDGSPLVFQRWDEKQPEFKNNDENCAVITPSMGFWHDSNCGYEYRFICKRSSTPPANATVAPTVLPKGGCPPNWIKFDSKCYSIVTSQKETWEGARTQCKTMGGNLASIPSRNVQLFLTSKMAATPATDLWIGLHNKHGGQFRWTDGRPMRYTNWGSSTDYHRSSYMYDMYEMDYYVHERRERKECAVMNTEFKKGVGKWQKKSCNDTNGYVCLRKLDSSIADTADPTAYNDYIQIFNESVKIVTQKMTWSKAKENCEADGATLVSLRKEWTNIYVDMMASNLQVPLWIGLNKKETGGYFRYIDNWPLKSTNWASREPRYGDCVYLDTDGKWRTARCTQDKASACLKSTEVAPTQSSRKYPGFCPENDNGLTGFSSTTYSWVPFQHHCYLFMRERTDWPLASANCVRKGATLASIEGPEEGVFIQNNLVMFRDSQSFFWLGLYKTHRGTWLWLDKKVMSYTNWDDSEPASGSYGGIRVSDGTWSTANRYYDRGYICKMPKVLPIVSSSEHGGSSTPVLHARGRIALAVILPLIGIVTGGVIVFLLYKKSGRHLPTLPEKLSTFDNPLFFNNERAQSNLVATNKLAVNAEEENPGSDKAVS